MNQLAAVEHLLPNLKRLGIATALVAVGLSVFGRALGLLVFKPGGSSFDTLVRPVFLVLFVVAALVAFRWQAAGGVLAALAASGVLAFATNQLRLGSALMVVAAFAVPAVIWVVIDLIELPTRQATISLVAALIAAAVGYGAGYYAYERLWGPTHPESTAPVLPPSELEWVWTGAVNTDRATVKAKISAARPAGFGPPELDLLLTGTPLPDSTTSVPATSFENDVVTFELVGLDPDTTYHYSVSVDGAVDTVRSGRFRTFPDGPASFTIAIGACARVGSNGRVFDAIDELDPLLYMVTGDFHYGDNDVDDIDEYRDVMDLALTQPGQARLYRNRPIAYVWDDHDYGANDSDGQSASRSAAMRSYRQYVPHYNLAGPSSAIYQAFTVGRVRFVMTDARSARDPKTESDDRDKSMLGDQQLRWLKDELLEASMTHELVVWVNPVPWVAEGEEGADNWAGYTTERSLIADYVADNQITNLAMISGDAHMVAIDDGSNTNYSAQDGPAFPLLHAAPLDRPGSQKGGPYSHGAIAESGQFATLSVDDDGTDLRVTMTAYDWTGAETLAYRFDTQGLTSSYGL